MAKIDIYTTNYCPYCKKAKALLEQLGYDFNEIDITENEDSVIDKLYETTGRNTVPQIFINDNFIGGADDLFDLRSSGALTELLK